MHAGHTERAGYCALYIVNYLLQVRWLVTFFGLFPFDHFIVRWR